MTIKYLVKSPRVLFCKQRFHEKTNDIFADFILSKCAMMLEEAMIGTCLTFILDGME